MTLLKEGVFAYPVYLVQRYLLAVKKHSMPQFQGNQGKDFLRVRAEIAIGTNKLLDGCFLEVSSFDRLSVGQNVTNLIFKIVSQPEFVRNRKTGFFPLQDSARNSF